MLKLAFYLLFCACFFGCGIAEPETKTITEANHTTPEDCKLCNVAVDSTGTPLAWCGNCGARIPLRIEGNTVISYHICEVLICK